jgi:hypothetical protein
VDPGPSKPAACRDSALMTAYQTDSSRSGLISRVANRRLSTSEFFGFRSALMRRGSSSLLQWPELAKLLKSHPNL